MYDKTLLDNDYFKEIVVDYDGFKVDATLDSLTKVLLRNYIVDYAKFLIKNNKPFSFQIIDLDNFKLINDNYGHAMGDAILIDFAQRLQNAVGNKGLVGRYGGDEFIIVTPNVADYDDVHSYITSLFYGDKAPLRSWYKIGDLKTFMTGTIGSASYPNDSSNFDDLFVNADKALYRGKQKGRNCFIVYVESKHKDINVNNRNKHALYSTFSGVMDVINDSKTFEDAILNVNDYLIESLKISGFHYEKINSSFDEEVHLRLDDKLILTLGHKETEKFKDPGLFNYMNDLPALSLLTHKISVNNKDYGYILMYENKIQRIWQDEDITLIMVIARLLYYKFLK
ncbi:MAG: GGDEF domain-containing protein [Acholeplasmatales bacterium]|nr:GGDEF domain-containing protein [Acholeplasmatales bacterium]